jgi:glycosyltransferase involved in cell wall biosynthesis
MTDPLGQSQVIPYLSALAKHNYRITILSAEKSHNYKLNRAKIKFIMQQNKLEWIPIMYTKRPPVLSTLVDVFKMRRAAKKLMKHTAFDLVHCRSYISPLVGNLIVKKQHAKFLFDMRGFWADERIDGGIWDIRNPLLKRVYQFFKKKEKEYLEQSNAVVSLTHNGKKEILGWKHIEIKENKISVIPCAADFNHFTIPTDKQRIASKQKLGYNKTNVVFCYLGSLGTWYLVEEMLQFFSLIEKRIPNAYLLLITQDILRYNLSDFNINPQRVKKYSAARSEVPELLAAVDIGISFIKPSFSKKSSSPTKMGEMLAQGIPIIVNDGVGDVAEITEAVHGGWVIKELNQKGFEDAIHHIPDLLKIDKNYIRSYASKILNLESGVARYLEIYNALCK